MILAGMDVSGNSISGNHLYMAIVIGTDNAINKIKHRVRGNIHMSRVRNKKHKKGLCLKYFLIEQIF